MTKYIGQGVAYGLFEKQVLVPNGVDNTFALDYQVGSVGSILVVYSGSVQEPGVDYALSGGGTEIVFSFVPSIGFPLYIIYMGKEMQVPTIAGNFPLLEQALGDGVSTAFGLPLSPLTIAGILVFKNGIQQRAFDEFTILGPTVTFSSAPAFGDKLDFYILGIERTDLVTVDPLSITNDKIANNSITANKLNLVFEPWVPVLDTFGGMVIDSQTIHEAEFMDQGQCTKIRLQFTVQLSGTPDNKIRFTLPVPNSGSSNVSGSVTLSSATSLENGILRWGGTNVLDIHRQFGVNYETNPTEWTAEVNIEYESA